MKLVMTKVMLVCIMILQTLLLKTLEKFCDSFSFFATVQLDSTLPFLIIQL